MWMFTAPEKATHHPRTEGPADEFGNQTTMWGLDRSLDRVAFDPGGTVEPMLPGQERVITTPTLYVPFREPIKARDQITVGGRRWEIDGDPADWHNPFTGDEPGTVVKLKRVEG